MSCGPEAVTFDFHNTLARCDRWFDLEVRELLPEFLKWYAAVTGDVSVEIDHGEAVAAYRRIRREIMEHGLEKDAVTCVNIVTRELGFRFDSTMVERGVQEVMRATLATSTPIDGVVDAVTRLHEQGISLGVVSSAAYHPFLEWSLDKFGILDRFETIVTSASCGYYKSRTEIYEVALRELDVEPGNAVHIGDSFRFDVATPSKLGMHTILFDENQSHSGEVGTCAVVTTLTDVDRVIHELWMERLA